MPEIKGLTHVENRKLPDAILSTRKFEYNTLIGKCYESRPNQPARLEYGDSSRLLGAYINWSTLYSHGQYVGFQRGSSGRLTSKLESSMELDDIKPFTRKELSMYKSEIFYAKDDYIAARELMRCLR